MSSGPLKKIQTRPIKLLRDDERVSIPDSTDCGLIRMQGFMATQQRKDNIRLEPPVPTEDLHFLMYPLAALNAVLNRTPVDLRRLVGQLTLYPGLAQQVWDQCKAALPEIPLSSMGEALLHLGVERIRVLLATAVLTDYCRERVSPEAGRRLMQIAEETARGSESLARMTGYARPARAYLAGLMHDVGKLALLPAAAPEDAILVIEARGSDAMALERSRFGGNSAESGEWLGEQLRLPENVVEVMSCYRFPQNARIDPQLVNIVALARWIAQEKIQRGDSGDPQLPETWPGEIMRVD